MTREEWELYEQAMKVARDQAKKPPQKRKKPSGVRPTKLFKKMIGS